MCPLVALPTFGVLLLAPPPSNPLLIGPSLRGQLITSTFPRICCFAAIASTLGVPNHPIEHLLQSRGAATQARPDVRGNASCQLAAVQAATRPKTFFNMTWPQGRSASIKHSATLSSRWSLIKGHACYSRLHAHFTEHAPFKVEHAHFTNQLKNLHTSQG